MHADRDHADRSEPAGRPARAQPLRAAAPAREVFRRHGLRCTRQREVVYDALRASCAHPTAEELHARVREIDGGISLATVYNTLDALAERGLVHRVPSPLGNGASRYDADLSAHVHLTLPDGRVVDVPDELGRTLIGALPSDAAERLSRALGVEIGSVSIELSATGPRHDR